MAYDWKQKDVDRFWSKVKKGPGCWNWLAGCTSAGYAEFSIKLKVLRCNRFVWELTYGEIPEGMMVLHKCDNRRCVRPDHLYLGSGVDNMNDVKRANPGFGSHISRLYEGEVWLVRKLRIPVGSNRRGTEYKFSSRSVAKMFKVNQEVILRIWSGDKYLCREGYYV